MSPEPAPPDLAKVFGHPFLDAVLPRFEECLRDVDGRPLGEGNAPEPARAGVSFVFRPCPYPESRQGGLMNMSALAPLASAWDQVLALLLALRCAFMARYPVPMNHLLLARMAGFLTHYSGWLVRSGRAPWNGVPRSVSGLYKAAQGLYFTANDAMLEGGASAAFAPVTPDSFLERTEARGIFRLGERVCAGPPEMVRRFVSVAIEGDAAASGRPAGTPPDAVLGEVIRYAELRLRAQHAERAHVLALALALDGADGRPSGEGAAALADLERQAGLAGAPAALAPSVEAGLPGLLRPSAAAFRAARLEAVRACAELWLRHGRFALELQTRMDLALGRAPQSDFDQERRLALLLALGDRDLYARADAVFDLAGLARLMDGARAAGPATCPHR